MCKVYDVIPCKPSYLYAEKQKSDIYIYRQDISQSVSHEAPECSRAEGSFSVESTTQRARTAAREKQTHNFSLPGHRILRMEELFWKLMIHRQCCSIRRRDPGIRQSPPFGAETFLGRTISSWVGGAGNSGAPDRWGTQGWIHHKVNKISEAFHSIDVALFWHQVFHEMFGALTSDPVC